MELNSAYDPAPKIEFSHAFVPETNILLFAQTHNESPYIPCMQRKYLHLKRREAALFQVEADVKALTDEFSDRESAVAY